MSDDILKDWRSTTDILLNDVLHSAADTERISKGYVRRNYVRAVFAAIEGSTYGLKRVVLQVWKHRQSALDAEELESLTETEIDDKGKSKKRRFLGFSDNIKFVFKIFAKVHGFTSTADYRGKGWAALLSASEIRDRLMHPKSSQDLNVSNADLDKIQEAADWYFPTRNQLVAQAMGEFKKGT